ncbi:DUF2254 domain-containing protein [Patiriisocius marinus]|uniref:DUF2254 domain-containing protein n=1 Tax=Patiriisocius marinus TaxID=1397112 RepID=UPI00232CADEF|nr:DUF2254 domain-containing protein [Patiriisocius marinus]
MKLLYNRARDFFNTIQSKIAFYPTLFAIFGFVLSLVMVAIEETGASQSLQKIMPQLMLEDGDTALTVMSTCVGGIISMMVFSFSMVMLLLSQASSNFSPRILPGLISNKGHQVILGIYLATIIYTIFTLFSIEPDDAQYTLPGIAILVAISLTIICLGCFIYFIHNISESIQINTILDKIYHGSRDRLIEAIKEEGKTTQEPFDYNNWYSYSISSSGYFQNVSIQNLCEFCESENTLLYIAKPKGFFVLQNEIFFYSKKELDDDQIETILSNINFSRSELVEDNYILAFKQITEIAVKAMSPGINDPGTAINAIDYLTELFSYRLSKNDNNLHQHKNKTYVELAVVTFEQLLYNCMASLRTYCKHDPIIIQKLIYMLRYLSVQEMCKDSYKTTIENEIQALIADSKNALNNKHDNNMITNLIN